VRITAEVRAALEAKGLPWAIEQGTKHHKIKINGRLVGIMPRGRGTDRDRAQKNIIAQIRRA
jgi:hypothetical protein